MEDTFQHVGGCLPDLTALFEDLAGHCDTHGDLTVKVRKGRDWYCPRCLEDKARVDAREKWESDRRAMLHKIARIPHKYQGATFKPHNTAHRDARGLAKSFFDAVVEAGRGGGWRVLMLIGEPGTGKTLMACEIAERLIEKALMSARYVTAMQMLAEIKSAYGQEGKTEAGEIQKFADYDLLIVDEIDRMRGTDNDRLLLEEVVNCRYNDERPMLVISNKLRDQLTEYVGDRVSSRFHERGLVVSFDWPDFRKGDAAQQAEPRSHLQRQTHSGVHSEIQFHRV